MNVRNLFVMRSRQQGRNFILKLALDKSYHACPEATREEAVRAALAVSRAGGSFRDAMEAGDAAIIANGYRFVKGYLMFPFRHRQGEARARLRVAREYIRRGMQGSTAHEIEQAIERARRVIDGNGTVGTALYFALASVHPAGAA